MNETNHIDTERDFAQRIQETACDIGRRYDANEINIRETIYEAIRRGAALGRAFQVLQSKGSQQP